jgi:hypothetical protein
MHAERQMWAAKLGHADQTHVGSRQYAGFDAVSSQHSDALLTTAPWEICWCVISTTYMMPPQQHIPPCPPPPPPAAAHRVSYESAQHSHHCQQCAQHITQVGAAQLQQAILVQGQA